MKTAVNLTIQFFESRYQKFEVFWPTHHKITTLQFFFEIKQKPSFNA